VTSALFTLGSALRLPARQKWTSKDIMTALGFTTKHQIADSACAVSWQPQRKLTACYSQLCVSTSSSS